MPSAPSITMQPAPQAREIVTLRQVIGTRHFNDYRTATSAALGVDTAGIPVYVDVSAMPHILIAGATGSGKSVALNSLICSMLYCATPERVRFVMIDPKRVELAAYAGLPHMAAPICTDTWEAIDLLRSICAMMDSRYKRLAKLGVRDVGQTDIPRVIVIIDELADLMLMSRKTVEPLIVRIAQIGRAAGIHLIAATQKPLVSVITGLIQANMPCKLALQTASVNDSVRILGHKGAEKLVGRGDALLKLPDRVEEIRMQCAYTSLDDVSAVVNYWRRDAKRK